MRKKPSLRQRHRRLQATLTRVELEHSFSKADVRRLAGENYELRLQLAKRPVRKWYNPLTWLR